MKENDKEIKLFDLEFNGEFIFVYSDKFNIFFFFLDKEDNKLYKITTDKYFMVEYIDEVDTPTDFHLYTNIKFFKPFNVHNTQYSFIGIVMFDNISHKFKIEDDNKLIFTEETKYHSNEGILGTLSCLSTVDIFNYIQKKNKVYLIGYDEKYEDYIYAIVNIEDNKFEKIYSITSDYGDIIPLSINTDTDERKVYIVGKIVTYDDNDTVVSVKPYFDMFLLV
jgi:hypothetical protein